MFATPWSRRGYGSARPLSERGLSRPAREVVRALNALHAEWPGSSIRDVLRVASLWGRSAWISWREPADDLPTVNYRLSPGESGWIAQSQIDEVVARARRALAEQTMHRFMRAHGWNPSEPEPLWTRLLPEPHLALLSAMGLDPSIFTTEALAPRLRQHAKTQGGQLQMTCDHRLLLGTAALPDRSCIVDCIDAGVRLTVHGSIPETVAISLSGEPIDRLALIGEGMPGTTIRTVQNGDDGRLRIMLDAPYVPLVPAPAGFDPAWVNEARRGL